MNMNPESGVCGGSSAPGQSEMPYATVHLLGADRDIHYRILSVGPGSGWEHEWYFTDNNDKAVLVCLTGEEEEHINAAINRAEGNSY
jgi:hypothetical protein